MAKRKFTVEVVVDLLTCVGLEFEVEADSEEDAEVEAAALAEAKLEGFSGHDKLELISQVVLNDGTIYSEQTSINILSEEEEEEVTL